MLPSTRANNFIKENHYSGKVVPNSKLHFGVFYKNKLVGVLQYGASMDKSKIIGLVKDAFTGKPVDDASVMIFEINDREFTIHLTDEVYSASKTEPVRLHCSLLLVDVV